MPTAGPKKTNQGKAKDTISELAQRVKVLEDQLKEKQAKEETERVNNFETLW